MTALKVSRPRRLALLMTLLAAIGLGAYFALRPAEESKPSGPPPVGVEVATVERRDVSDTLSATGEFKAIESVVIRPEIPGRVAQIHFKDGQRVRAGDLLVSLDDSLIRAELTQSEAEARFAEANYRRAQDLSRQGFTSSRALDEARAAAEVAIAKRDLAKARLDRTQLRAPFSGKVGLRQVSLGSYVKEGDLLVSLEDSSRLFFDFRVPERFVGQVRVGQAVEVQTASLEQPLQVKVAAIDARVEQDGRFLQIRTVVPNPDDRLKSGVFGKALLSLSVREQALVVSEEALVGEKAGYYVWRLREGKVEKAPIELGIRLEREIEVTKGLSAGDQVVIAGQLKIRGPGQPVRILNGPAPAPAPASAKPNS